MAWPVEITEEDRTEAARLVASGYRPTSNKYRHLSRIDREDWRERMADFQTGGFSGCKTKNREDGLRWVAGLADGAGDFYRRVISEDRTEASHGVFRAVKQVLTTKGASHGWGLCNDYLPMLEKSDVLN